MTIKTKLRIKMAEFNINQKDLSKKTGIRPNTIGAYVNDTYKHITREHLNALCSFFNCPIEDLIEYIDDKKKTN